MASSLLPTSASRLGCEQIFCHLSKPLSKAPGNAEMSSLWACLTLDGFSHAVYFQSCVVLFEGDGRIRCLRPREQDVKLVGAKVP